MNTGVNTIDNSSTTRAICSTAAAVSASYAVRPLLFNFGASIGTSIANSTYADAAKKNDVFKEVAIKTFKSKGIQYVDLAKEGSLGELQALGVSAEDIIGLKEGKSAYVISDKVYLNFDKLAVAAPHEAGHIKNLTSKNCITRLIVNLRNSSFRKNCLAAALACAAILEPTSNNSNDKESNTQKLAGFAKEHSVGLAALGFAPILADEGMASIKGYNMVKKKLSTGERILLGKLCTKAWLTYALTAAISVANVFVADKVKNALA